MEWIQTMRSFVDTVQQGSMSGASRKLGCSPASVSRHITSLEEHLGTQLLKRSSRSLALTEAGKIYYDQVEQILLQFSEANRSITELQTKPQGVLSVHSRMLVGQLMIVPYLSEFLDLHPDITVDLKLSNSIAPVIDQNTDIDIRIGQLEDSSLIARKLTSSKRIICATPAYIAKNPAIEKPQDLAEHNCITYRINSGSQTWRFLNKDDHMEEVQIKGRFQTDFGFSLLQMVKSSFGVALLPDWAVHRDLQQASLVRLLPDHTVSHMEFENGVYAVFASSRQTSPKIRVFIDFFAEIFRNGQI